ncbi:dynamin family protein [Salsuginibacillus halophilus]|uniref:Dynamin family protein n=1 Tax=Salsuginibacillus halophilus TaxID=517424 RepID=A0A2P8HWD3_9BACI|nr:dynamin family protein [Salsuginibacillus halophilus]PSL50540.1 dynamin family protein [Salsuginibacillus halophilus]
MTTADTLHKLHQLPFAADDERLQAIERKTADPTFRVAFCGHFSAGKSSVLNELIGRELLPASPIPTSANVIHLAYGDFHVAVETKEGTHHFDTEEAVNLFDLGTDGSSVEHLYIQAPLPFLDEKARLLDTPGVDSTDPDHQRLTRDALNETDLVVYVTDYNHVQSETNLRFLAQLARERTPFLLVINQIDKHQENELRFEVFHNGIKEMLNRWQLEPLEVYYTSVYEPTHPANQMQALEQDLKRLLYQGTNLLNEAMFHQQISAAASRLEELKEEHLTAVQDVLPPEDARRFHAHEETKKEIAERKSAFEEEKARWEKDRKHLYQNANVMSNQVTGAARDWLEAQMPGFKTGGWFQKKKKTAEEKDRRENLLLQELQHHIDRELLYHLRSLLKAPFQQHPEQEKEIETEMNEVNVQVDQTWLAPLVNTDQISRQFVYTFLDELRQQIIRAVKQQVEPIAEEALKQWETLFEKDLAPLYEAQLDETERASLEAQVESARQQIHEKQAAVSEWLKAQDASQFPERLREAMNTKVPAYVFQVSDGWMPEHIETKEMVVEEEVQQPRFERSAYEKIDRLWIEQVKQAAETYKTNGLLPEEAEEAYQTIRQFEEETYTISLFGAFSAGKSSFINALLGEDVLPVSPHPTTAVVQTVKAPTEKRPDRTAELFVKPEEMLQEEVKSVSTAIGRPMEIKQLLKADLKRAEGVTTREQAYIDYLRALKTALSKQVFMPGESRVVALDEMKTIAADELSACMLQHVDVYVDTYWTQSGIEWVDTPGVHSINGRHTNVAFEQLRASHAIFYVTYYHHAFSKADEYFLQQIASVQKTRPHFPFYFFINAADLAQTEAELEKVVRHVTKELSANDLQQPNVLAVASKDHLTAKQKNELKTNSNFAQFETHMEDELLIELQQASYRQIQASLTSWQQALSDAEPLFTQPEAERSAYLQALEQEIETAEAHVQNESATGLFSGIQEDAAQLVHYLENRLIFVMNDYYNYTINPAAIDAKSKKNGQAQLRSALNDWETTVEQFARQEVEATVLRLEAAVEEKVSALQHMLQAVDLKNLQAPAPSGRTEAYVIKRDVPAFPASMINDGWLDYFASPKQFFEQGGRASLKDAVIEAETKRLHTWLQQVSHQLLQSLEALEQYVLQHEKEKMLSAWNHKRTQLQAMHNADAHERFLEEKTQVVHLQK